MYVSTRQVSSLVSIAALVCSIVAIVLAGFALYDVREDDENLRRLQRPALRASSDMQDDPSEGEHASVFELRDNGGAINDIDTTASAFIKIDHPIESVDKYVRLIGLFEYVEYDEALTGLIYGIYTSQDDMAMWRSIDQRFDTNDDAGEIDLVIFVEATTFDRFDDRETTSYRYSVESGNVIQLSASEYERCVGTLDGQDTPVAVWSGTKDVLSVDEIIGFWEDVDTEGADCTISRSRLRNHPRSCRFSDLVMLNF